MAISEQTHDENLHDKSPEEHAAWYRARARVQESRAEALLREARACRDLADKLDGGLNQEEKP